MTGREREVHGSRRSPQLVSVQGCCPHAVDSHFWLGLVIEGTMLTVLGLMAFTKDRVMFNLYYL